MTTLLLTAAAASAADGKISKEVFKSEARTLITSNKGMDDINKIVKSLQESGLLIGAVSKTIKNKEKGEFFSKLLGILVASLLGNILIGDGVNIQVPWWEVLRTGKGIIRAGQAFQYCVIL